MRNKNPVYILSQHKKAEVYNKVRRSEVVSPL
jgi:hypothetical protein